MKEKLLWLAASTLALSMIFGGCGNISGENQGSTDSRQSDSEASAEGIKDIV